MTESVKVEARDLIVNSTHPQFLLAWSLDTDVYGQAEGKLCLYTASICLQLQFSIHSKSTGHFCPSPGCPLKWFSCSSFSCKGPGHFLLGQHGLLTTQLLMLCPHCLCWSPVCFASFFVLAAKATLLNLGKKSLKRNHFKNTTFNNYLRIIMWTYSPLSNSSQIQPQVDTHPSLSSLISFSLWVNFVLHCSWMLGLPWTVVGLTGPQF